MYEQTGILLTGYFTQVRLKADATAMPTSSVEHFRPLCDGDVECVCAVM